VPIEKRQRQQDGFAMSSQKRFHGILVGCFLVLSPVFLSSSAAAAPDASSFNSRCGTCHSTQPGKNGIGPSLSGIYGSTSGTVPGYNFSPAMKNAKIVWDDQTLDKFLQNPAGLVHGTKMFATVPDSGTRQQIIAYLQTLKPQAAGK
jgi:cytochrome c2